jgi:hypothetical protein
MPPGKFQITKTGSGPGLKPINSRNLLLQQQPSHRYSLASKDSSKDLAPTLLLHIWIPIRLGLGHQMQWAGKAIHWALGTALPLADAGLEPLDTRPFYLLQEFAGSSSLYQLSGVLTST